MTDRDLDLRLLAACAIVREAGKLAYDYFGKRAQLEIEHKGMQDLVSLADRAVEDLIRKRLSGAFPDDDLLGEEGGGAARRPGAGLWVIDPIDGTANFLRGMPYWSVTLAYVIDDRVEIGVTYDPVHDELFWARRGGGAYRNHAPIRVSGGTDPQQAVVGSTFTFKMKIETYISIDRGDSARRVRSPPDGLDRADDVPRRRRPPRWLRHRLLQLLGRDRRPAAGRGSGRRRQRLHRRQRPHGGRQRARLHPGPASDPRPNSRRSGAQHLDAARVSRPKVSSIMSRK